MSPWRTLASLLLASGCASPAPVTADSRAIPPSSPSIPLGQALVASPPTHHRPWDAALQAQLDLYVAREQQVFSRVFRDTHATTTAGRPAVHQVPVQAGLCYRIIVAMPSSDPRTLRLYDQSTVVDDESTVFAPLMVLGRRRLACAAHDGVWRLELSSSATAQPYAIAVLATAPGDPPYEVDRPLIRPSVMIME